MKTFIVLGMHRSATSLVAGGIKEMGVDMGKELLGPGKGNPVGHFENVNFMRLNDKILASAGGSWDNPPKEEKILALKDRFADEIKNLINESKAELWGWKDPRTVLTIELYLPYIENPHFIYCFREPMEVALSLKKRDNMPIEKGLALANEYDKRLLKFLNKWITKTQ